MHERWPVLAALSLILLTLTPAAITAQTTFAAITRTVTDSTGAEWAVSNTNVTPTNVSAGRISAVGASAGAIQQAGMRSIRLGLRMEW